MGRSFKSLLIALLVAIGSIIPPSLAAAREVAAEISVPAGRARINFNANWRFALGSHAGAEDVEFDDSAWERVGLPHSFSMPYFRSPDFYTGDGWYRKEFTLRALPKGRRIALEFEGAFQDARVYVNGVELARHRGGYTGFPVDITAALRRGRNVVAVLVNNEWQPTLLPRAGEHVFSGGLYRDVWLVTTDEIHVPWTGTRITTPELSAESGRVAAETEVHNAGTDRANVTLRTKIVDELGRHVASLPDQNVTIAPGTTALASQLSAPIASPRLWSPESPTLYRAITSLVVNGRERDRYETEFGFRWFEWTADRGFFLNGKHRYFRGANVHQDQAGWGDAVTNGAIERDVRMIKDAGFDFVRGSHYPHDPHFAVATDRLGMLFLSEMSFWGTAGFRNPWGASAYPTDPAHRAEFDANAKQQLSEMIRINRNHPSIVAWGMDNEVFFTAAETMPDVRRLLSEMVALSHRLDPSRPAAINGAQRGEIDKLGDIAGYNGDGASLFTDPGIPNFVAEYGSTMTDRPGTFEPGWGDLVRTQGADPAEEGSWRLPWRSGEVIWAGFDHGSIAGKRFGGMGMIDYARLPKRQYHWYRNAYANIPPPHWPVEGKPAALRITTSAPTIARGDGTDDVQVIVSVVDAQGRRLSNSPPVRLSIEAGPGELPTGRTIDFAPDSDIEIREGEAAIAMRSWHSGVTQLRATSPGLEDGVATVRTLEGPQFVPGKSALAGPRPYKAFVRPQREWPGDEEFGLNNPTFASSSAPGHSSRLVNDGDPSTYWSPATGDSELTVAIDLERVIEVHSLTITFPQSAPYGFMAEILDEQGQWRKLVDEFPGMRDAIKRKLETEPVVGRRVRIRFWPPKDATIGISELRVTGGLQN
ncbi:glycoside hydrolase family 2 TIM barrel-domain containing protein [Altererythrobacter sp.]|uniref:glycoside hydrolase family 2 protein n=1 Tax=Altererythrobacter sp. TaxID=1872480 RepID=UPI003D063A04